MRIAEAFETARMGKDGDMSAEDFATWELLAGRVAQMLEAGECDFQKQLLREELAADIAHYTRKIARAKRMVVLLEERLKRLNEKD